MRRFPWVATIIVLAAVGLMVRLGFWQLDRLHQKEAMIARYSAAESQSAPVPYPHGADRQAVYYRHSSLNCASTSEPTAVAGRNAAGTPGWAHMIRCNDASGVGGAVVLGWSNDPAPVVWQGGAVTGVIAPYKKGDARLVADPPLAGLAANALPDPRDVPNNHLSYAVQWFLFAVTALVIYGIALRRR